MHKNENNHENKNLGYELCYQTDLSSNNEKSRSLILIE